MYRHIRLDKNEVFYIGIGKDSKGKYNRAYSKVSRNEYWTNIVNITDYEVEIVLDGLTWEEAGRKEIEFVKIYGKACTNSGTLTNISDGGTGGCLPGKLNGMYGNGYKLRGSRNGMYGKSHNKNSIKSMIDSWDIDRRSKMSSLVSGDKNPSKRPEVAELISRSKLGDNNPMKKQHVKDKMVQTLKKTIELKRLNGIPRYKNVICPYCKKEGSSNNMSRYHFENCKQKQIK